MNLKNRLPVKITGIKKGKLNAHISLDWRSLPMSVIITSNSVDEMRLEEGDPIEVLFKASDVIIAQGLSGKLSARNILPGIITGITKGFPLAMITLDCKEDKVAAELTISSLEDMDLKAGDRVDAVIKSSELILAKKKFDTD